MEVPDLSGQHKPLFLKKNLSPNNDKPSKNESNGFVWSWIIILCGANLTEVPLCQKGFDLQLFVLMSAVALWRNSCEAWQSQEYSKSITVSWTGNSLADGQSLSDVGPLGRDLCALEAQSLLTTESRHVATTKAITPYHLTTTRPKMCPTVVMWADLSLHQSDVMLFH